MLSALLFLCLCHLYWRSDFRDLSQFVPKWDDPRWPVSIQLCELGNQAALAYFWANSLPVFQMLLEFPSLRSLPLFIQSGVVSEPGGTKVWDGSGLVLLPLK